MKLAAIEQKAEEESPDISVALEKNVAKEAKSPAPEAPFEALIISFDMLWEKYYPKKKFQKPNTMPGN